ncbi:MAG: hypothetical protein WBA57_16980 [Elainellaceae cyanobacterium]
MSKTSMGHGRKLSQDGTDIFGFDLGTTQCSSGINPADARSKKSCQSCARPLNKLDEFI